MPQLGSTQIYKIINNKCKGSQGYNTMTVGDFNLPLITIDRSSKQKINKETMALNDTLDQMDLTDNIQNFYKIHILFKCTWNILQNISHIRPQNKS